MRSVYCVLTVIIATVWLGACAGPDKPYWSHYDECSWAPTFVVMAECGKQKRAAYCGSDCTRDGNAFVQYADSLAQSVQNREISDAEARRKFIEYRSAQVNATRQLEATMDAAGPTYCDRFGSRGVICY